MAMSQAGRKEKGAKFEREVAKMFRKYSGLELYRTPLSGGWGKAKTKGDLVAGEGVDFPYFVECKKQEGWDLWNCLFEGKGPVQEWWAKAQQQAAEEGKIPLLVMAQRMRIPILIREWDGSADLLEGEYIHSSHGIVVCPLEVWLNNYMDV